MAVSVLHRLPVVALVSWAAVGWLSGRGLTLEERVRAQEAIERVYWSHRIWPKENSQPKPPLEAVMPEAVIRAKVEDYLKMSNALEKFWSRPITAEQLQSEIERMGRDTQRPEVLRELFIALDNDPPMIAECLARPALANRLIHNWYARDSRFHGALRRRVECTLARTASLEDLRRIGGSYSERKWRLGGEEEQSEWLHQADIVALDSREWERLLLNLRGQFPGLMDLDPYRGNGMDSLRTPDDPASGSSSPSLPVSTLGALQESDDSFYVTAVLDKGQDHVRTGTVSYAKVPFDQWWLSQRGDLSHELPATGAFSSPPVQFNRCVEDTWSPMPPSDPDPRRGHTAVWTGSEMIVWGGYNGFDLNTGGRYNPDTDTWTATSTGSDVPEGRSGHTAVWTGTEMVVWGGAGSTGGRYNPATDTWRPTSTASAPSRRGFYTMVWTGHEVIVWGGLGAGNFRLNDGGIYDPLTDTWRPTSVAAGTPSPRYKHTAVWTGNRMIVWGGGDYDALNTGGVYDPVTDSWSQTSIGENVPAPRLDHVAVWDGREMIIWESSGQLNTGGRYNPATDSWTPTSLDQNVPVGRRYATAVWTGREMVVWGGFNLGSLHPYENSGGRYDPQANSWRSTSIGANVPEGRQSHTVVWTGEEIIVWGGYNGFNLNTGGRYNPDTDTWVTTGMGTVPSARAVHSAVWTGSEMIVWGGGDFTPVNTGGRYNPSTDTWTPTSVAVGVPAGRSEHTALWTGTEMVVWGGTDGFSPLNSGGRYNPLADTWTPTNASVSVPAPRRFHTAVWTGQEMIIWGGQQGTQGSEPVLNSGAGYDPSTDTWRPTSRGFGVPAVREGHTAVWMNGKMIVWGGGNSVAYYLNTGGRYDPRRDIWMPTSTGENVPAPRSWHSAVAAGDKMIVWGGVRGPLLNTGGRYDPETDTWTPTSTGANVPVGTYTRSTVWTGTEMIVWGGMGPGIVNTGGRYDPETDTWTPTSTGLNVPAPREWHTAVWTGTEMIVWGGFPVTAGGRYCSAGCVVSTWYRDADGDGFGDPIGTILSCSQPPGYASVGGDCDDGNREVNPAAPDLPGDMVDQDCDGTLPCDPTADYSNHGAFVSCVAREADRLLRSGRITAETKAALVEQAARSDVGRRR